MKISACIARAGASHITGRIFTPEVLEDMKAQIETKEIFCVNGFPDEPAVDLSKVIGVVKHPHIRGGDLIVDIEIGDTSYLLDTSSYRATGTGLLDAENKINSYEIICVSRVSEDF